MKFGSNEYLMEVARGNIHGADLLHVFGSNNAVPNTPTSISMSGVYRTPSLLTSLELLSDSALDAPAAIGGRKVTVYGIGTDWALKEETVTLNGITAVALVNQYYRVFRMDVVESGSYATETVGSHQGTITLRESGAGQTWAAIFLDNGFAMGKSEIGAYTIPKGYTGYIVSRDVYVDTTKQCDVVAFYRQGCDDVLAPYSGTMRSGGITREMKNLVHGRELHIDRGFTGPCDLGFMARNGSGSGTAKVSVEFQVLIVKDTAI